MTNIKIPTLSPTAKIVQDFSTTHIEITYSRPSVRGRVVFGNLVPYGKLWRTGANVATRITTNEDLEIGGQPVKAGEYALYTIPGETSWEVILNTGTGNWGVGGYNEDGNVARFTVPVQKTTQHYDQFTIDTTSITYSSCNIEIMWDNVKVVIPVVAHNEGHINEHIAKLMQTDAPPYYQVATYFYETRQNLDKAKEAIDKAVSAQPKAFFMWFLKAKIEKALGNKEEARSAADNSISFAAGTPYEMDYINLNGALLADMN